MVKIIYGGASKEKIEKVLKRFPKLTTKEANEFITTQGGADEAITFLEGREVGKGKSQSKEEYSKVKAPRSPSGAFNKTQSRAASAASAPSERSPSRARNPSRGKSASGRAASERSPSPEPQPEPERSPSPVRSARGRFKAAGNVAIASRRAASAASARSPAASPRSPVRSPSPVRSSSRGRFKAASNVAIASRRARTPPRGAPSFGSRGRNTGRASFRRAEEMGPAPPLPADSDEEAGAAGSGEPSGQEMRDPTEAEREAHRAKGRAKAAKDEEGGKKRTCWKGVCGTGGGRKRRRRRGGRGKKKTRRKTRRNKTRRTKKR